MKLEDSVYFHMAGKTNFTLDDILFMGNVKTLLIVQSPKGGSAAEALKKEMSESRNSRVSSIVVHCIPSGKPEFDASPFNTGYPILFEKVGLTKDILLDVELMVMEDEQGRMFAMRYTDLPSTVAVSKRYFGRS